MRSVKVTELKGNEKECRQMNYGMGTIFVKELTTTQPNLATLISVRPVAHIHLGEGLRT